MCNNNCGQCKCEPESEYVMIRVAYLEYLLGRVRRLEAVLKGTPEKEEDNV